MLTASVEPAAVGHILNIGSGVETPTRDLVRLAIETAGGSPEVIYNPRNEGGVKRMRAGIDLARRILRFQPTVPLAEGLRRTFEADIRVLKTA
jgi:nucleoside-diphosphate-sugar epimerase